MTWNIRLESYFIKRHLKACCFLRLHKYDRPPPPAPFGYVIRFDDVKWPSFICKWLILSWISVGIFSSAVIVELHVVVEINWLANFCGADINVCSLTDVWLALAVTRGTAPLFPRFLNKPLCYDPGLLSCSVQIFSSYCRLFYNCLFFLWRYKPNRTQVA